MKKYIAAFDQGTTSCRCIIFDRKCNIVSLAQKEFNQYFPQSGYVEHDAEEIYNTQIEVFKSAVKGAGLSYEQIAAIGITNQRETTVIWHKYTGKPIYNAIVWQCRRTAQICEELKKQTALEKYISENTGLVVDAYFSATKIKWLLDNVENARQSAENGELLFGTVDSWLLWKMTGGKVHATDYTNASRTMLYNIVNLNWDENILNALDIPKSMLPEVKNNSEIYGYAEFEGCKIPISGIAGDQQSALFGQACFSNGQVKNTYGTGNFILMNIGSKPVKSKNGLLTTIAYGLNGNITYALEGSVFVGGAALQWLRDELEIINASPDSEDMAFSINDNGGVYFVPAFTGIGAPYWDMYARGAVFGISRGTDKNHIVRAALESIAYQSRDVINAMKIDSGIDIKEIRVDGGASRNNFLIQFQSDISNTVLNRPEITEITALGAAFLAGLAIGYWDGIDEITSLWRSERVFTPKMGQSERDLLISRWEKAVDCTRAFSV